jgi:hypothetical protein
VAVEGFELASHVARLEAEDRRFDVCYWLVRERMGDGIETYFVRCCQWEVRNGRVIGGEAEVAGLGADPGAARQIYGRLVAALALPVHLQDVVQEARRTYTFDRAAGRRPPYLGPDVPEPPEPEGGADQPEPK